MGAIDRVEMKLVHHGVDAFLARQPVIRLQGVDVFLAGERALGFGLDEDILAEIGHLFVAIALVELDDVLQRCTALPDAAAR